MGIKLPTRMQQDRVELLTFLGSREKTSTKDVSEKFGVEMHKASTWISQLKTSKWIELVDRDGAAGIYALTKTGKHISKNLDSIKVSKSYAPRPAEPPAPSQPSLNLSPEVEAAMGEFSGLVKINNDLRQGFVDMRAICDKILGDRV